MIRFSKLFFGFTVFVLLLWLLPWAYNFAFYKPERTPFTLWSCVVGDFAVVDFAGDGIVRRDRGGRTYTDREFDSILPTFYARQLLNDERFPDSLCGVAVTPRLLQSENFMFRSTPAEINKPRTRLYPLLESMWRCPTTSSASRPRVSSLSSWRPIASTAERATVSPRR